MAETKKSSNSIVFIALFVVVALSMGAVWWFVLRGGDDVKYTLTYELNGKTVTVKGDDYYALKDKLPKDPEKEGYLFGGYYLDENFATPLSETNFDAKVKAGETVKLTLKWYNAKNTNIQNGLKYTTHDNQVTITEIVDKTVTEIVIPDAVAGLIAMPVTEIANSAFKGCVNLQKVVLSENITKIGSWAFEGCAALEEGINFSANLTSIGKCAFEGCSSLTNVVLPQSLTSIGDYAFADCTNLVSITVPDSVTTLGFKAFDGCPNLVALIDHNYKVVFTHDQTIPDAYNGGGCAMVEIREGVTSIDDEAFYSADRLTQITIPSSVTRIGDLAFSGCSMLKQVIIADNSKLAYIGYNAFNKCSSLESLTIPNSVINIGDSDAHRDYIASVFGGCSSLTNIIVGEENTKYSSLDGVLFNKNKTKLCRYPVGKDGEYIIPSEVITIGYHAFESCSKLTSVSIPNSVTSVDICAFECCSSLTSIAVDRENKEYSSVNGVLFNKTKTKLICYPAGKDGEYIIPSGVTSIGGYAFEYCSNLTSVSIPNEVTSIGYRAFEFCSNLTNVLIPNSVTSIGEGAFRACSSLTNISIPSGLNEIDDLVFYECSSLTNVTIPDNVTRIGRSAFDYCSSLTSLTIPSSVTSIDDSAFDFCYSLAEIINKSSLNIEKGTDTFGNVAKYAEVVVSGEATESYTSRIQKENGVYYYVNGSDYKAIACDNSVTTVELNSNCTEIRSRAFCDCKNLTEVTLSNSVINIGDSAFGFCSSLTSITILCKDISIGDFAFIECSSLTDITFQGTQEEWNAIEKGFFWDYHTGNYTVHCLEDDV